MDQSKWSPKGLIKEEETFCHRNALQLGACDPTAIFVALLLQENKKCLTHTMPRPREDGDKRVLWPLRCQLSVSPLPVANGKATAAVPRDGVLRCCRRRSLIPFRRYIAEQRGNIKRQSTVRMMFFRIWMRLVDRDRLQCQEPHHTTPAISI